jgi:hypothetical protein
VSTEHGIQRLARWNDWLAKPTRSLSDIPYTILGDTAVSPNNFFAERFIQPVRFHLVAKSCQSKLQVDRTFLIL